MDYKELFYKDSVEKQVTIKSDDGLINITNSELEGETMELTESICSEDELTFGACSAAQLKFTVSDIQTPLQGKWLNVDIELKSEDISANPYRLGRYKVCSDKPTVDRTSRDVIAYDVLYDIINADVADWYNSILPEKDSAVRLKKFRDSFFEHFGVVQEDIALVNDSMWVERTVELSELSGATVINCICEINGCMGHINRSGKFEYVYLKPISSPDDISKDLYISATYEDYIVQPIDKLQIRQEEDDIGAIVGDGSNSYIIEDNFLVYGKSSTNLSVIANNILMRINGLSYRPFTVECVGNPCITLGAAVSVVSTYATINSYVLTRTLKGVQSLSDTYEAAGEEYRTSKVNGVHKQIIQLKNKANILNRSIEETRNTITDVENGLKNEILATTTQFDVKLQSLQSQVDGEIEVINGNGQPTLYNYPAYNWVSSPKVGDVLVEGLRFTYSDAVYNKHQRTLFFDEDTSTTYRFISKNGIWVWEPFANAEFSLLQKQITDMNVTAQGITSNVEELSAKVTNEYITQIDAKTLISQTAYGIKEDISEVYSTKDEINTFKNNIEKTAQGLAAQISEVNEALDGANEVYTIRGQPTLYNYPAYNWTAGPKVGDKLVSGLKFTYSDESYKKHKRALVFDEVAGKTYRFIKSGATWLFSDVGDTEFSWVNKKLAEYKVTVDGVSADLSKFETKVGADYITKVDAQASIKYSVDGLETRFNKTLENYTTTGAAQSIFESSFDTKADGIYSNIKETYATKTALGDYSTTRQMNTAIEATARTVKSTVASSSNQWDYSKYWHPVNYSGYGAPWDAGYADINQYRGKTYLDAATGYIYYCCNSDGSYENWFKDYKCPAEISELKTQMEQVDGRFKWLVKSGDSEANMVLTDKLYSLVNEHIDLTGLVTVSSLKESGETIINADNITTGTINALAINGCTITGSAVAFANDSGGWNAVFNSEGMWIIGTGTVDNPNFMVDKWGFVHLGNDVRMSSAGVWLNDMFKSWASFF